MQTEKQTALKERQAAEVLGVSIRTLQAWRYKRTGPDYLKLGGAVRYEPAALEAFKMKSRVQA